MKNSLNLLAEVASSIRLVRKSRKLTQKALSERTDTGHRYLQSIESGTCDLKLSTIDKFAKTLSVPACYLLESNSSHKLKALNYICPSQLLDIIPVGVQVSDISGLVVYSNRYHSDLLGLSSAEIVNKKYIWDFIFDVGERDELKEYLKVLVKNRPKPTPYFTRNQSAQGEFIPVRVDWNYILDDEQEVSGFISLITCHPSW